MIWGIFVAKLDYFFLAGQALQTLKSTMKMQHLAKIPQQCLPSKFAMGKQAEKCWVFLFLFDLWERARYVRYENTRVEIA